MEAPAGDHRRRAHRPLPQLVTLGQYNLVETGRSAQAWRNAQPTFTSRILGPHFEQCARDWLRRRADEAVRGETTLVAASVVNDRAGRAAHEIDVLGLRRGGDRAEVTLVGEAKATLGARGPADLDRLERIKELLHRHGHDVSAARLGVFSLYGFDRNLLRTARRRHDVLLVDLHTLLGHTQPPVVPRPG